MSRIAPYAQQHLNVSGPGDSRPSALKIVEDQNLKGAWSGKVVLVTGCSPGGLGPEIARAMHATGADVFITARDIRNAEVVAEDILSDGKPGKVEILKLDLASLDAVREAARNFLKKSEKLNVLINNAGVMACPQGTTNDGFETQFGSNHLGHFLLFQLLGPTLLASSTPGFHSRVVSVSSVAHRNGSIQFDDFHFTKSEYDPWKAYGQSKLANIYFANELERRYGSQGLHGVSAHPGGIATPLQRHVPELGEAMRVPELAKTLKSTQQGAATIIFAGVSRELERKGGIYVEDCSEAVVTSSTSFDTPGYSTEAFNPHAEKRLWEESLKMVGLGDDFS
ncbi:short-chain dehydrogenase [Dactylonectria macrodidyma]|uniref:Short-chain dehydrogenase n=1 Tax=Dactylonectria macrodidyma TaxID=307937 RepID=A0A9P9F4P7_9HYPO|nr:short-chain dehydrogenase [Dactylonectria macrodidyma]